MFLVHSRYITSSVNKLVSAKECQWVDFDHYGKRIFKQHRIYNNFKKKEKKKELIREIKRTADLQDHYVLTLDNYPKLL